MPVEVTVVIPTLNEAARIRDAVEAARWAAEVIVVDGGSNDETREIARAAGAKVLELRGSTIGAQRNAGIEAAAAEWVLALDADERATDALIAEIELEIAAPRFDAYRIRFSNIYLGREIRHGEFARDWHVRLFRKTLRFSRSRVHEHLESPGPVGSLRGPITHDSYRDIHHHAAKVALYARWGAEDLLARGRRVGIADLALRPAWRFFRAYVLLAGFLDGYRGFILAVFSAYACFLKYAGAWRGSER